VEWLRIYEKVVTDYSAMAFEAAILDRELYIYQPDVNSYEQKVGLNVDLTTESISEYVCHTEQQLFDKINEPYKMNLIQEFKEKYMEVNLDNCTGQICTFIAELLAE
jgi:CDP-ribitol ribitolphosphotransferase